MESGFGGYRDQVGLEIERGDGITEPALEHVVVDAILIVELGTVNGFESQEQLAPKVGAPLLILGAHRGQAIVVAMVADGRGKNRVFSQLKLPRLIEQRVKLATRIGGRAAPADNKGEEQGGRPEVSHGVPPVMAWLRLCEESGGKLRAGSARVKMKAAAHGAATRASTPLGRARCR